MPAGSFLQPTDPRRFAWQAGFTCLGLFAILRLAWVEANAVIPITDWQSVLAARLLGPPAAPIAVTSSCSGTDAIAMCVGVLLAYPSPVRTRLAGAVAGTAMVIALNVVRIGSLGRVAASPAWFNALHVYVWPTVLTLAIAGFVLAWMSRADGQRTAPVAPRRTRHFVALTMAFLTVFTLTAPLYRDHWIVMLAARFAARAAAALLGNGAHADGNVLWTITGGVVVTGECLLTPVIPIYLAAACAYARRWPSILMATCAAVPVFVTLGVARLLLVALPAVIADPLFAVHAFYQVLLGTMLVFAAAWWRHHSVAALGLGSLGLAAGVMCLGVLGPVYAAGLTAVGMTLPYDAQGAIAFLPAFQIGLYAALAVATAVSAQWRRYLTGLAILLISQVATLTVVATIARDLGLMLPVAAIRAWAIAGPALIVAGVMRSVPPRR